MSKYMHAGALWFGTPRGRTGGGRQQRCLLAMTGNESIRAATVVLLREAR